ncbi:hypothetical protein RYX36_009592 [Vicia faba]
MSSPKSADKMTMDNIVGKGSGDEESDDSTTSESEEINWERMVKPVKARAIRTNIFQIPRDVIRTCLSAPHDTIELFDTDMGESYYCELGEQEGRMEKYLCSGWYEFANDRDLSEGDVLTFCIWYPPATRILVCVEKL